MATILPPTDASVHQAARFLVSGDLVALPTETVYGLAADATNPEAVAKIFAAKDRPSTNPLIVHIDGPERVLDYAEPLDDRWQRMADAFWPGPLTLILPRREKRIVDAVTAGLNTVGLRVPDVEITRKVIREAGKPLAAPSANPAGYVSPTSAAHVQASLGQRISYIMDGGDCQRGIESTILDLSQPNVARLLRPGPLSLEDLETVLGTPIERTQNHAGTEHVQVAPGQFSAHYQPRARVELWSGQVPIKVLGNS
ncbi:MAG: L-threonylcarbamoyladenylate synthase, partial [Puniceicoccales bacterium]